MSEKKVGNLAKKWDNPTEYGLQSSIKLVHCKKQFNQPYFDHLHSLNKAFLSLFWANNQYLRISKKISKSKMVRDLSNIGFRTTRNAIQWGEEGKYYNFALTYLNGLATYWNVSLTDMLYKDFSKDISKV